MGTFSTRGAYRGFRIARLMRRYVELFSEADANNFARVVSEPGAAPGADFYDKSFFAFGGSIRAISTDPLPVIPTLVFDGTFARQMVSFYDKVSCSDMLIVAGDV